VPVGFGVPGEAPSEDGFDGEVEAAVAGAHRPDADPVVVLRAEAIDLTTSPTGRRALRVGPVAAGSHDAEWGQLHGPHPGWSSGQVVLRHRAAGRPGRGERVGRGGSTRPRSGCPSALARAEPSRMAWSNATASAHSAELSVLSRAQNASSWKGHVIANIQ